MRLQDPGKHLENTKVDLLHPHTARLKTGSIYKAWVWIWVQTSLNFTLKVRPLSADVTVISVTGLSE